jgi:iron complex outermembrane receptor protein
LTLANSRATPPLYPFILLTFDNVGSFDAYGLEASLSGRLMKGLAWSLNYSWTKADQDIDGNSPTHFENGIALDVTTPEHKIKGQISYERGPWLGAIAARYTSSTQQLILLSAGDNTIPVLVDIRDSLALDAKIAFKATDKLSFEIAGENLTNAGSVDLSPVAAERRLRAGVRLDL